jgi:membrane protease YdiL (CAAX protease family)
MMIILEIILVFIIPIAAIQLNILKYKERVYVFAIAFLLIAWRTFADRLTFFELGIRSDNLLSSFLPYLIFTFLGTLLIYVVAKVMRKKHLAFWWKYPHFQYLFIGISLVQEFVYRSFLIYGLRSVTASTLLIILINALLFCYIHIIYPGKKTNLILAFIGGLGFAAMYLYFPNLLLISVSHSVFNFIAVVYGLVGPQEFGLAKEENHG